MAHNDIGFTATVINSLSHSLIITKVYTQMQIQNDRVGWLYGEKKSGAYLVFVM